VENTFLLRPAVVLPAAGGGCLQPVGKVVPPEVDQKGVNGCRRSNVLFYCFCKEKKISFIECLFSCYILVLVILYAAMWGYFLSPLSIPIAHTICWEE
jgi:hypothetical protein